jgi:hypothetical protein
VPDSLSCFETVLIHSTNDVGRVAMQVRLGRWHGLSERWDHFCNGEHVAYHQRWAAAKLAAHLTGAALIGWGMGAVEPPRPSAFVNVRGLDLARMTSPALPEAGRECPGVSGQRRVVRVRQRQVAEGPGKLWRVETRQTLRISQPRLGNRRA